jgi:hypothetical protein
MTESAHQKGLIPKFCIQKWVFYKFWILLILCLLFNGFSPFLGDIGHFWSPNFGRKLEMSNQLQIYINQACLRPWRIVKEQSEQSYAEEKPSQSHFYAGKILRSRRCRAISGSSGRPFCVPFSLQGS